MKTFFKNNWQHFAAVFVLFIITLVYCSPVLEGYSVKQHDVTQFKGMVNEIEHYREKTGNEVLWTNSMFGGMPAMQISVIYAGNLIRTALTWYEDLLGRPFGIMFAHMIGFYILALFLRIKPLVAMLGAVAMTFASYEVIVIQAGHNSKAMATALMAPVLGSFIYCYRSKKPQIWTWALAGILLAFQLATNHLQVTYYLMILLVGMGIFYAIHAIVTKQVKTFAFTTLGLLAAYALAAFVNLGNLTLTNEYATHTTRGGNDVTINVDGTPVVKESNGLDREYITNWSYGIGETFTLISPNVKGGGSFPFGGSHFEDKVEKAELTSDLNSKVMNYPVYWGDQPFTSGPVYLGVVVAILAILGLIFLPGRWKYVYFIVAVLAIMLSWGKNFMGFTDFFIDHVPGYAKFRTVTIILVLVELIVAVMGMVFLDYLIQNKEAFKEKRKALYIASGAILIFLFLIKIVGLKDGYTNDFDRKQLAEYEQSILNQLNQMDPEQVKTQVGLDMNNEQQVDLFVEQQVKSFETTLDGVKEVRKVVFNDSMNRTIMFSVFALAFILIFVSANVSATIFSIGMIVLVLIDVVPVAYDYLGKQEEGNDYKYYVDTNERAYPMQANLADYQILEKETASNPSLAKKVNDAGYKAASVANQKGFSSVATANYIDAEKFQTLNANTNYRVFEPQGGFNSSRASYFHKSIGGYHGAKLRNIQNLIEFQLYTGNNKVYDMLNVRYILQGSGANASIQENPNAAGNAWLVKTVSTFESPNDEIRALGMEFEINNSGQGTLLVNGKSEQKANVYGTESIQYVMAADTIEVNITNGIPEGLETVYVMDSKGKTSFVMPEVFANDTAKTSFLKLVNVKAIKDFDLKNEALLLNSEAKKLGQRTYSGQGTVKMTAYAPNHMIYQADLDGKQLVVFSEIYYKDGWKLLVDGKQQDILKVNYLLRGAEIAGGKHKVEMIFELDALKSSNVISAISSIALLVLLGLGIFIKKRKHAKED